jgi:hypothetical protein
MLARDSRIGAYEIELVPRAFSSDPERLEGVE